MITEVNLSANWQYSSGYQKLIMMLYSEPPLITPFGNKYRGDFFVVMKIVWGFLSSHEYA